MPRLIATRVAGSRRTLSGLCRCEIAGNWYLECDQCPGRPDCSPPATPHCTQHDSRRPAQPQTAPTADVLHCTAPPHRPAECQPHRARVQEFGGTMSALRRLIPLMVRA